MKRVLVLCTGNSCRSQIAEAYLKLYSNPEMVQVYSAGIATHGVNPQAIATMLADGIDISTHTSINISEYLNIPFDYVITVCDHANEQCPILPGNAIQLHHNFTDPAKATGTDQEITAAFEKVRNEIKEYCKQFVMEYVG
jgi:arsenate reductase (thioredoxin)